jgi:MFS family permease
MLELLKDKTYVRYWLAVVIAFLGDGITRMAVIYLIAKSTDDPFLLALVIFAQLAPSALLGVFVGPLTDRFPKRYLMVGADLARAALILTMIFFAETPTMLLVLVLLCGMAKTVFEPARIASIPRIVGGHSIPTAIALFQSTVQTVNMVGPMLAGLLLVIDNPTIIFSIGAATFVISAILLGSLSVLKEEKPSAGAARTPYFQSLGEGIRGTMQISSLRYLIIFMIPVIFVVGLFTTNYNALLLQEFDVSALHFGLLEAAFAVGAIVGAMIGPNLMQRYLGPGRLLFLSTALFGLVMIGAFPLVKWMDQAGVATVYVWCLLAGLSNGLYNVPLSSIFLLKLPKDLVGRGLAMYNALMNACTIVGVLLGGWLAKGMGISNSVVLAGCILIVAVFVSRLLKGYNELQSEFLTQKQQGVTLQK